MKIIITKNKILRTSMSVFLVVALIFCMVVPSYALVPEGILIYKGITISAAAIKTLLVLSGVTVGTVAIAGVTVNNADKIAYTASSIWDDIKQSATTAAQTVKEWVSSWFPSASDADTIDYTTPITQTWSAEDVRSAVDAFREYLSLSTTTSATGQKILHINTLDATYTITASKSYVQGDVVFTVLDGTNFVAFPVQDNGMSVNVSSEDVVDEAIENFVSAMTLKGVPVVKIHTGGYYVNKYHDTVKIRSSESIIYDVTKTSTATSTDYQSVIFDSLWNTADGKKITNVIPLLFQTVSEYPTVTLKSDAVRGEEILNIPWKSGLRISEYSAFSQDFSYVAVVPYISYFRNSSTTVGDYRNTSLGYASLMVLVLTPIFANNSWRIRWTPFSLGGKANWIRTAISDGYIRNADASVPIDCDVTISTETGTLVNVDEVRKETPILGIDDVATVPADVLTGDVVITLPTTSDVTLEDALVTDVAALDALTEAGVKTDAVAISTSTVIDPSPPVSGDVEFPTGVFDGIWKYVVHLVEKGSEFVAFLGDCLSCIPQEISWCFYGGLVLIIFGTVISKMLL